jgi:hypothetical protein
MRKMRFEADMVMKELYKAFQSEFNAELPMIEKMVFDLRDGTEKKQHDTVKMNQKEAMMQLALSFNIVSLLNKLNCKKRSAKTKLANGNGPPRHVNNVEGIQAGGHHG